jgi:hypothetical protein
LLFQFLDNKQECYKIFCQGKLFEDYKQDNLTHTWAPSLHLPNKNIEFAQIWCQGKTLSEVCPEHLKKRFTSLNNKAMVYLRTFYNAKVDLQDVCFYDLVPEKFLLDFYEAKNDITRFIFETYQKPKNYEFLMELLFFVKRIEQREINLDMKSLAPSSDASDGISKLKDCSNNISYNPWGTVTGRLTTNKSSFPILTLNKKLRGCVKPQNDVFVELDFNAAELRVLLGLLGEEQPDNDMHTWIGKNVFNEKFNREEVKKKVFAWLYNPKSHNKKLDACLNRDKLYDKYYEDEEVFTPFGRVIPVTRDKAVNYLIQSTSSDMLLTSAIKIDKMLKQNKSFVSFCIHDSIILDMSLEDREVIEELKEEFSKTMFGTLRTNLSLGKDFGSMEKIL